MECVFRKMKLLLLTAALLMVSVSMVCAQQAKEETEPGIMRAEVMGTARIIKDDEPAAIRQAVNQSLKTAVEQVVVKIIPKEILIRNLQKIHEVIQRGKNDFVVGYKVLSETRSDKVYRVLNDVTISAGTILKHMEESGITTTLQVMPSVLFLVSEQSVGDPSPRYWWTESFGPYINTAEARISEKFTQKGFTVVEHGYVPSSSMGSDAVQSDATDKADNQSFESPFDLVATQKLARKLGAELIVMGSSMAEETSNTMGEEKSIRGTVSLRVFKTDSMEEIAHVTENVLVLSINPIMAGIQAVTEAGDKAGENLAETISASWSELSSTRTNVRVTVQGADYLSNLVKLRGALAAMPGVNKVATSEMQAREAILTVDFNGNGQKLGEALMLVGFDSFGIDITQADEESIVLRMVTPEMAAKKTSEETGVN